MAASDARPIPRKNTAYRVTFPILDADGDLVTGATGLDSEVSIDAGTFTDCTNEATEIATSSGVYYLDLTSSEMNGDTVAVIVKTSSSGAKTTVLVFYPEEAGDVRVDVVQISGDTTAADNAELMFDGTGYAGGTTKLDVNAATIAAGAITATAIATGAIDADAIADGAIDSGAFAAGAITAAAIADGAIDAATFAADADAEIAAMVWNAATATYGSAGSYGEKVEALNTGAVTVSSIGNDVITAASLNADAASEIGTAVWATATRVLTANTNLNDPTAAAIADAVWDEAATGHTDAGKAGQQLWTDIDAILVDTTEIGVAGAGLTNIDLPNQTFDLVGNITGNLSGSVGSVTGNVTGSIGSLATQAKADVNAEVLDVLSTDTVAEPAAVIAANAPLDEKIAWLAQLARNKITQTASAQTLFADDATTTVASATVSDSGTVFTRGEWT